MLLYGRREREREIEIYKIDGGVIKQVVIS